jgi:bacteriophage N4 adsorption protein A
MIPARAISRRMDRGRFLQACLLLLSLLLALSIAKAQQSGEPSWAQQLSKEQRFLVFPHIDAGFRALKRDDHERAVQEFTRASAIAPGQPVIAGYLAQALADGGNLTQAIAVLDQQLSRTPNDQALLTVKQTLQERQTNETITQAQTLRPDPEQLRRYLQSHSPLLYSVYAEREWLDLLALASTPSQDLLANYAVKFVDNETFRLRLIVKMLVRQDDLHEADDFIEQLPASFLTQYAEVDNLSYQLLSEGHAREALLLLIKAYPYESNSPTERQALLKRMIIAQATVKDKSILQRFVDDDVRHITTSAQEREWLTLMSMAFGDELAPLVSYRVKFVDNRPVYEADILEELKQGAPLPSARELQDFVARLGQVSPAYTEVLSYRLFEQGAYADAWSILMGQYPFQSLTGEPRDALLERLLLIAKRDPSVVTQQDLRRLSMPLGSTRDRSIQADLLETVGDCAGIRRVLGDYSNGYGVDQWMLLGGCYEKVQLSGLAQLAYEQAAAIAPSAMTERAVAYTAFENKDYEVSLQAWHQVLSHAIVEPADLIAAATTAMAANQPEQARVWLDRYASLNATPDATYWTLSAQAWAAKDLARAMSDMQRAIAIEPLASRFSQLGQWQLQQGDSVAALASLEKAVALAPEDGVAQSELGFLYYDLGQLSPAQKHLTEALALRPADPQLIEQLAYVDQQLGENEQSMHYIRLAVDHDLRFLPQERTPEQDESLFALRRMYEDLNRRWTFSFDALTGSAPSLSALSPQPGVGYRSYSQLEVDYRLGDPAVNNGKTLSVYSRVFGGSGVDDSPWPIYAPTLGVGLRWKPFSEQVFYLSIEKQIPLDHGTSAPANTMLRASASLFNSGVYSDDWHPTGPGWLSQNLYLDAAYYLSDQAYSLLADYRIGYHNKIKQGQTIEPYGRTVVSKLSGTSEADVRAGVGVRWNIWGLESRYSAYASQGYVGLEIQGAIQTEESDRVVAIFNIGVRW